MASSTTCTAAAAAASSTLHLHNLLRHIAAAPAAERPRLRAAAAAAEEKMRVNYRSEYQVPEFLVPEAELEFSLGALGTDEPTTVKCVLRVERAPGAPPANF